VSQFLRQVYDGFWFIGNTGLMRFPRSCTRWNRVWPK
jgi:hypothetical protein